MTEVHGWLQEHMREAGLETSIDPAGNLIGRWQAGSGRAVVMGSHMDTVPQGGRFDGALGVVGALAAVETLRERGFQPARPIWVVSFMDEEGRFGPCMLGSRAFVGNDLSETATLRDASGVSLGAAMAECGFDHSEVPKACAIDRVGSYVELHIEQGPVLDERGIEIGIVTGIVGLLQARVTLRGEANHAGTTPMDRRHDPLAGAARVILDLREQALARDQMTSTVGAIRVEPGAFNVVPGLCAFSVDMRVLSDELFAGLPDLVKQTVDSVASDEGLSAEVEISDLDAPVRLDEKVGERLRQAADLENVRYMEMPSGAGHDAMILAPHVPSGMLFVPSAAGISHSPREFTSPEHCETAVQVLARAIESLAA